MPTRRASLHRADMPPQNIMAVTKTAIGGLLINRMALIVAMAMKSYRFSAAGQFTTTVMGSEAEPSGAVERLLTRNRFPSGVTS